MSDSGHYKIELPAGGVMPLESAEEQDLLETSAKKYIEDYNLSKQNDLILVGSLLTEQLVMFRAQRVLTRPNAEQRECTEASAAQRKAAEAIVSLEKNLGIDKKSREAGGEQTLAAYIEKLKRAARQYGIHISERLERYEAFNMEMRWKLRLLANGDAEDMQYHDISPEKICDWARNELAEIEALDQDWAREKGAVVIGQL